METKVWFRNAHSYIRELIDSNEPRIVWSRATLIKKEIDPNQFCGLHFGVLPWEALVLGNEAVLIDAEHTLKYPKAVYPIWSYGDDLEELIDLVENPVGEDQAMCEDTKTPIEERPVFGQSHIIVIKSIPVANSGSGRRFLKQLKEIKEDYPAVTFHLHGLYSFRALFGMGFGSGDVDALGSTKQGKVILPPGSEVKIDMLVRHPQWTRVLGFSPVELNIPRNRVIFNIKSACWAAKYWDQEISVKTVGAGSHVPDLTTPDAAYYPPTVGSHTIAARKGAPGDKIICNDCSLAIDCKFYRADYACGVPRTETAKLASFFGTRDSHDIVDGLTMLVKRNAERLDQALDTERVLGDVDPQVSKQLGQVFDQGIKLAKLVDPSLRGGPQVQVNVGSGGTAAVSVGDTRSIVAAAMRELEASGIKREEITSAMIEGVITRSMTGASNAAAGERVPIEGHVVRPPHPDMPTVSQPVPRT